MCLFKFKWLRVNAKVLFYWPVYFSVLNFGHKLSGVQRIRLWIWQAADINFLQKVSGLSLRDRMRCAISWEGLRVKATAHSHLNSDCCKIAITRSMHQTEYECLKQLSQRWKHPQLRSRMLVNNWFNARKQHWDI